MNVAHIGIGQYKPSTLGIVASHRRRIKGGEELAAKYFSGLQPVGTDPVLSPAATVFDTLDLIENIVKATRYQTVKLAADMHRSTVRATSQAIFDYFYNHYQYRLDDDGVEQLRAPIRAYYDRKAGIDCDCFAISVSSVLSNLGIPHSLRIIKIKKRPYYQHIYVVVPSQGRPINAQSPRKDYIVIDPVLDSFDMEAPEITSKYDKIMIPVQFLNGVSEPGRAPGYGEEFTGLGQGLSGNGGQCIHDDFLERVRLHLINTKNLVTAAPEKVEAYMPAKDFVASIDDVLTNWNNPATRAQALERASALELKYAPANLGRLSGMSYDGYQGFDGLFKTIGNAVKQAANWVGDKVGDAAKAVANAAKQAGQFIVKNNPITLSARAGLLLAMRLNVSKMAGKLRWAYATQQQAASKGISASEWNKAKSKLTQVENLFADKLGGSRSNLKDAILANGRGNFAGLGVADPVSLPVTLASALPLIGTIVGILKDLVVGASNEGVEATQVSDADIQQAAAQDAQINAQIAANGGNAGGSGSKQWIFWTVGGTLLAGALTTAIILATRKPSTPAVPAKTQPVPALTGASRAPKAKAKAKSARSSAVRKSDKTQAKRKSVRSATLYL